MKRVLQLILVALTYLCAACTSALGQSKVLVVEWVNKDVEGVSAIVELIPFERQNIEGVKARLRSDWHVEESNLGFGAKYMELEKGQGYSMGYVHALIYNGRVARYEAGIESYSEEWSKIKARIIDKWKKSNGPEASEEEHRFVYRRTLDAVLDEYQANIASALGPMSSTSIPLDLMKSYATLSDPMKNSTLSGTHRDEDIETLVNAKRIDLLENVLRGDNPGARVLAAIALLELEKSGTQLSSKTRQSMDKVVNLNIKLHACVYDMCSNVTAQEALHWFDSGLAFPRSKIGSPRERP